MLPILEKTKNSAFQLYMLSRLYRAQELSNMGPGKLAQLAVRHSVGSLG